MTFMYSGTTCARVVPATITPNRKRENKRTVLPLMDTPNLVLGYKKSNKSPILKLLLSRLDELVARVLKREKA